MRIMMGGLQISDELLGTFAPIGLYWAYSGIYVMLGSMDNYRLHTKRDEDEKNLVAKKDVVIGVLLQQALQAVVATILFAITGSETDSTQTQETSIVVLARQFFVAVMVLDTWQYFMHRYMHHNKFLYKAYPFSASQTSSTICFWSVVQSSIGGGSARHSWWVPRIPHLRHVSSSFHLLFLCYTENSRRPLWAMAARKSSPVFL